MLPLNIGCSDVLESRLAGPIDLTVLDVVNAGARYDRRKIHSNNSNRTLKLHLTDGTQHVFAMEYKHCPNINVDMPNGSIVTHYYIIQL